MRSFVLLCALWLAAGVGGAQPPLSITRSVSNVSLTWPIWPVDLTPESTADFSTWLAITNAANHTNNMATTSVPVTGEQQFVRLKGASMVPTFQFGIFYALDLEMAPGPNQDVSGRVHGNSNLFIAPQTRLSFLNPVTAAGAIYPSRAPGDPLVSSNGVTEYRAGTNSGVRRLRLPVGTNEWHEILYPPAKDDRFSQIGRQRFYYKADVLVLVSNTGVHVTSGVFNNFALALPDLAHTNFIRTNAAFFNRRENKQVRAVEINIASLVAWSTTNATLRPWLGRDLRLLYVADFRFPLSAGQQSGVRLVNGQTLPPLGLTVATPNPLYIKGHYNAPAAHLGTAVTSQTRPAALLGDAITFLSSAFRDDNATSMGAALPTTVNAALVSGIVPTAPGSFSGGQHNFIRLLEDWSGGVTLTFNGSMAALFASRQATVPWGGGVSYYRPPSRRWAFDRNFLELTRLPPGTPFVELAD